MEVILFLKYKNSNVQLKALKPKLITSPFDKTIINSSFNEITVMPNIFKFIEISLMIFLSVIITPKLYGHGWKRFFDYKLPLLSFFYTFPLICKNIHITT